MKKFNSFLALLFLVFLGFSSINYSLAQSVVGKLYTKADANTTYGPVQVSVNVDTKVLQRIIKMSPDFIMFNIKSGKLMITNRKKEMLFSNDAALKSAAADQVFHYFSTSKIIELLKNGGTADVTSIELRNNETLTVTNGTETLERSILCPPNCP